MPDRPSDTPSRSTAPAGETLPGGPDATPREAARAQGIVVLRDFCLREHGADCDRCARACPCGALSFEDGGKPAIDAQACSHCGICLGICDAFSSTRVTTADLHARVRRVALRGEGVVLTCEENVFPGLEPAANVIVLPCLAALSPELWTAILAEGAPVSVAADLSYCGDCSRAGAIAETLYTHAIETAQRWSGKTVGFLSQIPEKDDLVRGLANPEGIDRRSAFAGLVGGVEDIASGKRRLRNSEVLRAFHERRERARAMTRLNLGNGIEFNDFAPEGRTRKTMHPKRKLLLEAIDRDGGIAARVPLSLARADRQRCTGALDCAAACPTGARFPDPSRGTPAFDARYCIGCGLCVDACASGAIELAECTAEALKAALRPADGMDGKDPAGETSATVRQNTQADQGKEAS